MYAFKCWCFQILIATGSHPRLPPIQGIEHAITSDDFFTLPTLPKRVVIVGGGYIGVEIAGIWHSLGVEVHLIIRGNAALRNFDSLITSTLDDQLRASGIHVYTNTGITSVEKNKGGTVNVNLMKEVDSTKTAR